MSVINKMLRDLDARRLEGASPGLSRQPVSGAMLGTASVAGLSRTRSMRPWLWAGLLLVLLLALAWYGRDALMARIVSGEDPPVSAPVVAVSAPVQEPAPGMALTREPPAEPAVATAQAAAEPVAATPPVVPEPAERATAVPATVAAPVSKPLREAAARPARTDRPLMQPPGVSAPAAARPEASPSMAAPLLQRRQAALQETLAQAQSLWNTGSREAALALLQEAVAMAERAYRADGSLRDQAQSLAALAREQARMELALGRPGAALALLTRLEPVLAEHGDLWAMRGNAAQRLARHEEAVQAYESALQRRPDESRWMLGAAVSLAALGRLEEAATQAERARAQGPVSPEVLTYLRQSGVPLR